MCRLKKQVLQEMKCTSEHHIWLSNKPHVHNNIRQVLYNDLTNFMVNFYWKNGRREKGMGDIRLLNLIFHYRKAEIGKEMQFGNMNVTE